MVAANAASLSSSVARWALALVFAAAASPALAQEAATTPPQAQTPGDASATSEDSAPDIVVTGTLIRGIAPVGAPVLSISSESIAAAGVTNSTEMLRKIPQVANIGTDEAKTQSTTNLANANNTFGSGINLRGLGTQATLTLVDGFRPAPQGIFGLYFDASTIPTIALGGIDVVADGASALYGSDAIAGVVNLKLRRDVDGVEVSGRYGIADDYHSYQLSAIAGKHWSGGSLMVAGDYSFHTALYALDRADVYQADQRAYGGTDQRSNFATLANIAVGSTIYGVPANPNGAPLTFANLSTTPNLMSGWTGATAIPEQNRKSVVAAAHQDVTPNLTLYAQGFFTRREFSKQLGRIGVAAQQQTLTVRNTNPFFIPGVPGTTTSETVRLSFLDILGPENSFGYQEAYQVVGGFKYDLTSALRLDVSYNRSYTRDVRHRVNQINLCALSGTTTPITPVCTVPAGQVAGGAIAQPVAANAFNPFGPTNPAVIDRIRAELTQDNFYKQDSFAAKLDGSLFSIGGGDVRFALGATTLRESAGYQTYQNNDTADNSIFRVATLGVNSRRVNSLFGEVVVPLVGSANAMPWVQSLAVSVAGRYDHYSDQGSTTNPKVGVTWGVSNDFKIRGSYGKSFRASLIQTDPAANGGVSTRPLPDYRLGAGATTNFIVITGGNRGLRPEKARTFNIGADYKPEWAKGLSLSATYFDIDYKDIIDNPGNTIGTTGITSAAREATFQAFIQRRPTDAAGSAAFSTLAQNLINGPLLLVSGGVPAASTINVIINAGTFNSGRLKARGIDFSAFYAFDTGIGNFEAGVVGTYLTKFDRTFSSLEPLFDRRGLIEFPTKYNLRGSFEWSDGGFRMNTYVNYLPSYTNTFTPTPSRVKPYTTVDMSLGYTFEGKSGPFDGLGLSVEIQNLFNVDPPRAFVSNQLFDSNNASALGRQIAFRVRTKF